MEENKRILSRIRNIGFYALSECSESTKDIIYDFFDKCRNTKTNWEGSNLDYNLLHLVELDKELALTTKKDQEVDENSLLYIKGIMMELDKLYTEVVSSDSEFKDNYIAKKVDIFKEIFQKNRVVYRHLLDYKNLYLIINIINNNYDELLKRGFNIATCRAFLEVVSNNKKDTDAIELFMDLINGIIKLQPVYELKAIGYAVKPSSYNRLIVEAIGTDHDEVISLSITQEEFKIENEEELVRKVEKRF